jgi:putative salt-induced outer membrane protein YdiY
MSYNKNMWLLCLFLTAVLHADSITFNNGDQLTGVLVKLSENIVTFDSKMIGKVNIKAENIASITTVKPANIRFKDGKTVTSPLGATANGVFAIKNRSMNFSNIECMNCGPSDRWKGTITAGYESSHGNTRSKNAHARISISRKRKEDRTTANFEYYLSKERGCDNSSYNTTEDSWLLKGKHDFFFDKKRYGFINGSYETDKVADLNYRTIMGGGFGYQWIDSPKTEFATEIGLASLYENFDNGTSSNSKLTAQAGYNFSHKVNSKARFLHELTWFPSTDNVSDYYLTSNTELRYGLTEAFFLSLRMVFDYDSTPAKKADSTDLKYLIGAGMSF